MTSVLSYGHQNIDDDDRQAVLDALDGERLTQGPLVDEFERGLREYFGVAHATVCSSGTAALHLAARCLEWQPGDVVLVPAITFLATANCCAYVGAEPFFVDVDPATVTIDPGEVERHVKRLRSAGRRVRAVIGVDMAGHACDWAALRQIADRHELQLVADSCHAMGGRYSGDVLAGSCTHSDLAVLSFHPVKHITTAEGGALLARHSEHAMRAERLRSHGTVRGSENVANWEGPWHYDMVELGYNYRLTDLQCSLGISQLRKLDRFVAARRELAARYDALLNGLDNVRTPVERAGVRHAFHLYTLRIDFPRAGLSRRAMFAAAEERGILLQVHYQPLSHNSYYRELAASQGAERHLPEAERYYRETVSIPLHPGLHERDLVRVASMVSDVVCRGNPSASVVATSGRQGPES